MPLTVISNGDPAEPLHRTVRFRASALMGDRDFQRSDGQPMQLFCVLPIYKDEAAMAINFIPDFLNALDRNDVGRIVNVKRPSIAKQ